MLQRRKERKKFVAKEKREKESCDKGNERETRMWQRRREKRKLWQGRRKRKLRQTIKERETLAKEKREKKTVTKEKKDELLAKEKINLAKSRKLTASERRAESCEKEIAE